MFLLFLHQLTIIIIAWNKLTEQQIFLYILQGTDEQNIRCGKIRFLDWTLRLNLTHWLNWSVWLNWVNGLYQSWAENKFKCCFYKGMSAVWFFVFWKFHNQNILIKQKRQLTLSWHLERQKCLIVFHNNVNHLWTSSNNSNNSGWR